MLCVHPSLSLDTVPSTQQALAQQHERVRACAESESERRERAIEQRVGVEQLQRLQADLDESEAENSALRQEVRALQDKLMALLAKLKLGNADPTART